MLGMKNSKGFSLINLILVLAILATNGVSAWLLWRGRPAEETAKTSTSNQTATKDTADESEWATYTNEALGFSINYPKEARASYGDCEKKTNSYRPKEGVVPNTVIEDGDTFYIVPAYVYQLTGETTDAGVSNFSGCEKLMTTAAAIKDEDTSFLFDNIELKVTNDYTDAEVLAAAKEIFQSDDIKITSLDHSADGDWQDVKLACTTDEENCMTFNYRFELRHYHDKKKLVYIELGQAGKLLKLHADEYYDQEVVDSFKLL